MVHAFFYIVLILVAGYFLSQLIGGVAVAIAEECPWVTSAICWALLGAGLWGLYELCVAYPKATLYVGGIGAYIAFITIMYWIDKFKQRH